MDYEDFLRQRGLAQWAGDDPRRAELIARRCTTADEVAAWVMELRDGLSGQCGHSGPSTKSTPSKKALNAELSANAALVLLAVACGLLDRQLSSQAAAFTAEGGFTERLHRVRTRRRISG